MWCVPLRCTHPTGWVEGDMSNYRRSRVGRTFFFTVVTDRRRPILTTDLGRSALREAMRTTREDLPFRIIAIAILPDHLHAIWELPPDDADYSNRWRVIKASFTKLWRRAGGSTTIRSVSRQKRGEQGVWQRRFFEHVCRDERDLKRCVDYVHVNPLKHGLVERVCDWPWSSFHRYGRLGEYGPSWGSEDAW